MYRPTAERGLGGAPSDSPAWAPGLTHHIGPTANRIGPEVQSQDSGPGGLPFGKLWDGIKGLGKKLFSKEEMMKQGGKNLMGGGGEGMDPVTSQLRLNQRKQCVERIQREYQMKPPIQGMAAEQVEREMLQKIENMCPPAAGTGPRFGAF